MSTYTGQVAYVLMPIPDNSITDALFAVEAEDPEWVADLVDTYRTGEVTAITAALEELIDTLWSATKARAILASLPSDVLRQGLTAASQRRATP